MQMVGTLFTSMIGGGGAAAAGAAAGGVGTAATIAGGLGKAAALLSGAGTVFSAISTMRAGREAQKDAELQAREVEFQARNEYIEGKETSSALRRELTRTIANQTAAFASSGVDLGSVSVQEARNQATRDAERELSITSNTQLSRTLQQRRQAAGIRRAGANARAGANIEAGAIALQGAGSILKRG